MKVNDTVHYVFDRGQAAGMDQAHELQDIPQRLQHAAAQIEAISTLESRHVAELNALQSQYTSEVSGLQARHAEEKHLALQGVLGLHEQLAAALLSLQHDVQQVSLFSQFEGLVRRFAC